MSFINQYPGPPRGTAQARAKAVAYYTYWLYNHDRRPAVPWHPPELL